MTVFRQCCNPQIISILLSCNLKWRQQGFKRALTRPQKGIFYKPIRHLLEGKRACVVFEMFEKSLQICLPVYSSTNLCSSVTLSFIRSISSTRQPVYLSTNLCSSVTLSFITSNSSTHQPVYLSTYITLSFITSNSFTCPPCSLVYLYYYIYLPWNRFFCVVPLHRHQE